MKVCTRCRTDPRLLGQRWCRACFTVYRREQRSKARAGGTTPLTPAQPSITRFWCRQYPFFCLKVPGVGLVRFQDGLLETADPQVIAAIRRNDWYGGIIQEGEQPPPPPPATPTPERPRAASPIIPKRLLGDWKYPWRADDR